MKKKNMREKLIEADIIESVIGIGKNLFFNSPMEACIVICKSQKNIALKNKILFIDAKNLVTRKNAQSFLETSHIDQIVSAYENIGDIAGFATVADKADIVRNGYKLSIPLYINKSNEGADEISLLQVVDKWKETHISMISEFSEVLNLLKGNE